MAIKQVVLSDLSGEELDDDTHARVVVTHPDLSFPVALDMSTEEAGKLASTTLRFATFEIREPNQPVRTVEVETKVLDKLFNGVNFDDLLAGAPKAEASSSASRTRKPASGQKIDYTQMDNIAVIHRGKVTEEEARLVRENMAQANKNREREGQPAVGDDPKDSQRYGL